MLLIVDLGRGLHHRAKDGERRKLVVPCLDQAASIRCREIVGVRKIRGNDALGSNCRRWRESGNSNRRRSRRGILHMKIKQKPESDRYSNRDDNDAEIAGNRQSDDDEK